MHPVLDVFRNAAAVGRCSAALAILLVVVAAGSPTPSHAQAPGYVSVVFAKAGLIVGAGGGRGVLTYRGRDYPFRVSGLSIGLTIGASAMRLTGRVSRLRELKDFSGTYDAVGAGGALGWRLWRCATDQRERRDHHACEASRPAWNLRPTGAGSGSRCSRAGRVELAGDVAAKEPRLVLLVLIWINERFSELRHAYAGTGRTGAPLRAHPTICRRYLAQAVTCGWLNTIERA